MELDSEAAAPLRGEALRYRLLGLPTDTTQLLDDLEAHPAWAAQLSLLSLAIPSWEEAALYGTRTATQRGTRR